MSLTGRRVISSVKVHAHLNTNGIKSDKMMYNRAEGSMDQADAKMFAEVKNLCMVDLAHEWGVVELTARNGKTGNYD